MTGSTTNSSPCATAASPRRRPGTQEPHNTGAPATGKMRGRLKKAETIAGALGQLRDSDSGPSLWTGPEANYSAYLSVALKRKLAHVSEDAEILTCADFLDRGVHCCTTCHDDYPDEMELVEFQAGQYAWVCCRLEQTLRPAK